MHPAASVIFFTTTSGAGYGMLALMGILAPLGLLPADRWFGGVAIVFALGLVSVGLMSSTFHLHHPERAWRAFSQWRSSWLSREGVAAMITFGPALLFAAGWVLFGENGGIWGLWGVLAAIMAIVTIFSTAMIYASLKTIRQWHHRLVPPVYIALGLASGAIWLAAVAASFGISVQAIATIALVTLILGTVIKYMYWSSVDKTPPKSTAGTATGLGHIGTVRQFEAPHTEDNWVMREMGFRVARKHTQKLRRIVGIAGFAIPLLCLLAIKVDIAPLLLCWLAAISVSVGVVTERWLFFAEAQHVVGLFYGRESG